MVPQYHEGSYQILFTKRMKNPIPVGLDDTAILHIKIKITEIMLEKSSIP